MTADPDRHGVWVVLALFVLAAIGAGYLLGSLVGLILGWMR